MLASSPLSPIQIPSVKAATIFSDGFESGDFSAWTATSGTIAVNNENPHHGTYSAEIDVASGDGYCYQTLASGYNELWARGYFYIDSDSGSSNGLDTLLRFMNQYGGIHIAAIGYIGATRTLWLHYRDSVGQNTDTSATVLPLGTWFCLELHYKLGTNTAEVHTYLDGVEIADLTHTGFTYTSYTLQRVYAGAMGNYRGAVHIYFDCVVVADAYIGPEVTAEERSFTLTETLKPTATLNQWQEHQRIFTQTVTPTETVTYWQEQHRFFTETTKPSTTLLYWLEGVMVFTETFTNTLKPTATLFQWQEQNYVFTGITSPSATLLYGVEGFLQFIEFLETVHAQATLNYWIKEFYESEDIMALAALALVIALAALAIGAVAWTQKRET